MKYQNNHQRNHTVHNNLLQSYFSSDEDDEADGTLDLTKFESTTENFSMYITDNDDTITYILEKNNQIRKMQSKQLLSKPELCTIRIKDCREVHNNNNNNNNHDNDGIKYNKMKTKPKRYDQTRHYELIFPCEDRKLYSDLYIYTNQKLKYLISF